MRILKSTFLTMLLAMFAMAAMAQMQDPVHFSVSQKQVSPTELEVIFKGKIDKGWHVYSTGLPAGGPVSATLTTEKAEGVKPVGKLTYRGKEVKEYDKLFEMTLRYFVNSVTFVQKYKITGKTYKVKGFLEFGACNDENCMPPTQVEFSYSGNGPADAPEATEETAEAAVPADSAATAAAETVEADSAAAVAGGDLWKPAIKELQAFNGEENTGDRSWLYIFLMGFVGGFIALFTPCVWPIIPMTVSFFLKRAKDKKKGIRDAITYGVSIVVIY